MSKPQLFTKHGVPLDEAVSALAKAIRLGDEREAVRFAVVIAADHSAYAWRRVLTAAGEDIGLGAPGVVAHVHALHAGWAAARAKSEHVTSHALVLAVVLLYRAPKSAEIEDLLSLVYLELDDGVLPDVPDAALDCHTARGRRLGRDVAGWFQQRHDEFGFETNAYTRLLANRRPQWFAKVSEETRKKLGLEQEGETT